MAAGVRIFAETLPEDVAGVGEMRLEDDGSLVLPLGLHIQYRSQEVGA